MQRIAFSELAWLPYSLRKRVPKIPIYYKKSNECSGYFSFSNCNPQIVITDLTYFESTLAHEFCHYLQYLDNRIYPTRFELLSTYEESIYKYFNKYKIEREALEFEYKFARNELNEWWRNKLILASL